MKRLHYLIIGVIPFLLLSCRESVRETTQYKELSKTFQIAYDNQQYSEALRAMDTMLSLAEDEKPSFSEFYNYGNLYFRQGEIGKAILFYERALRLKPHNKQARHNLMIAKSKIADHLEDRPSFVKRAWYGFCFAIPSYALYTLSLLFFLLFACGVLLFLTGSRKIFRKAGFYAAILSLLFFTLSLFMINSSVAFYANTKEAIVINGQVSIKSAPATNTSTIFRLSEGTKCLVHSEAGNWLQIEIADGKSGWVERKGITFIYPFNSKIN